MIINRNFKDFKFRHRSKKNQTIYTSKRVKNDNEIYLVKIVNSKNKPYSEKDENYLKFVQNQNTENRKSILGSYDQLLNNKYKVQLNQKTIDRVKNYFK